MKIEDKINKIDKKLKFIEENFIDETIKSIRLDVSTIQDFRYSLNIISKLQKENEELKFKLLTRGEEVLENLDNEKDIEVQKIVINYLKELLENI